METYFRLSQTGVRVPKHWAYSEAWELEIDKEGSTWIDNRGIGFQVWINLGSVVVTLLGYDRDGIYSAKEYPTLLLVRPSAVSDSSGEWYAVDPSDVVSARSLRSVAALGLVLARYRDAVGAYDPDDIDAIDSWVSENQTELVKILWRAGKPAVLRPVETLPKPR